MKRRMISCFTALLFGFTLIPASGYSSDISVVKAADQYETGNVDGYDYELWNQNDNNSVDMQVGNNGAFSCSWNDIEECYFRTGKKSPRQVLNEQDYSSIVINYDVDYQSTGNSFMGVYGCAENPGVEYHIIEAWTGEVLPEQKKFIGTIMSDGKLYDTYISILTFSFQRFLHTGNRIVQYWSINKTNPAQADEMNNLNGTITVSNHVQAWKKCGFEIDNRYNNTYNIFFGIKGNCSSGKADIKKNELIIGSTPVTTTQSNPTTTLPAITTLPATTTLPVTTTLPATTTAPVTTTPKSDDVIGDVDCNGAVTAADLVNLMQAMIGKTTLSAQSQTNADYNRDGNVSVLDVIMLKNLLILYSG